MVKGIVETYQQQEALKAAEEQNDKSAEEAVLKNSGAEEVATEEPLREAPAKAVQGAAIEPEV